MKLKNLIGEHFGKYTVISQFKSKNWKRRWLCKCMCGKERVISTEHLTSGKRTGCNTCNNGNLKRPYEGRYNFLVTMSKGRCEVKLSYKEYLLFVGLPCEYCNGALDWTPHGTFSSGHHMDRKNNMKGYTKKNCVPCCGECNRIKSNKYTHEQMKKIGELIKSWLI